MGFRRAHAWYALGTLLLGALLALGLQSTAAGAHAKHHGARHHSRHLVSSLAQGKPWRHGVVPRRATHPRRRIGARAAAVSNLNYGGGINDGTSTVGVTTGAPKVYIVFWGSQWGNQATDANGNLTFNCTGQPSTCKGDPKGMAPQLQRFFRGLGNGSETWSGVMTQYCQATTCSASTNSHVGYPNGGAFVGAWLDNSGAAPSQANAHQLAVEAAKARDHFSGMDRRNSQIFVVSPTGTHPDSFNTFFGNFCAWHDYTGDSGLAGGGAATGPWAAFTNMPYVPDAGSSCGQGFVNAGSAGTLDGVTIVGGHEYAETISDQYPAGGWTDSSGNENGDKCAWINSSTSGSTSQSVSQNISLTTGKFAVQSTWANDRSSCQVSEPIISNGPSVTVSPVSNQSNTAGDSPSVTVSASENGNPCTGCTFTATGLPSGLSISGSGGQATITGQVTRAGTSSVTVTAADSSASYGPGSTSFTWTVSAGPVASLTISPSSATVGQGRTQTFSVTGKDAYQNTVDVSGAQWSVSPVLGSFSPSTGSSTAFTASTTSTGPGNVYASVGNVTTYVPVTVNAAPADPIINGGFEQSATSLSGWTLSGVSGAENVVTTANGFPCSGNYCADLGKSTPTNGDSNIAQTFTVPSGTSTLSFSYRVVCPDTVTYDWATATLKDNTAGTSRTVLGRTCSNTGSWSNVNSAVTASHSYTLTLTSHDDNYPGDPTYVLWDNVSVK